jgi:hypothetical protein
MRKEYGLATRCLLIAVTAAAFLRSEPGLAQVGAPAMPAMGATSPLGSVGPTGIPMGSVELSPGGLSPTTLGATGGAACSSIAMSNSQTTGSMSAASVGMSGSGSAGSMSTVGVGISGAGIAGSMSTFDGGGMNAMVSGNLAATTSTMPGACNTTAAGALSSGTSTTPSITAGPSSSRVGVPLGSTELGDIGSSPSIAVPTPVAPAQVPQLYSTGGTSMGASGLSAPCGGAGTAGAITTGMASANGC